MTPEPFLRPPIAFGRRCPRCRQWAMRLPGDSSVPILIAAPRTCGQHRCGTASARQGDHAPAAS